MTGIYKSELLAAAPLAWMGADAAGVLWLLLLIAGPLIVFAWVIHLLEWLVQRRLAARFGWNSVLWTGWLGAPVHELSHALMCVVFRHEIVEMALFRPDRQRQRLGYVVHTFRPGNIYEEVGNFFIGVAPLAGGTVALLLLLVTFWPDTARAALFQLDPSLDFWTQTARAVQNLFAGLFATENLASLRLWLFLYLVLCIGSHMGPSRDDYRGALKGGLIVLVLLVTGTVAATAFVADPATAAKWLQQIMVPVLVLLVTVVALCGLAAVAVYLLTDVLDRIAGRGK